jgi:hypothetical protein
MWTICWSSIKEDSNTGTHEWVQAINKDVVKVFISTLEEQGISKDAILVFPPYSAVKV